MPPATNVRVGDKLVITLNSNASTGYTWAVQGSGISDTGMLKQLGKPKVIAPKGDLIGAPGKTRFTFQAVKKGSDQLEFWYARPSDASSPGASYALIVNVAKGHLPVTVSAGEDYTAEAAEIRTGDTLVVEIGHASASGKAAWTVASSTAPVKLVGQKWTAKHGGTATLKFTGKTAGTGALVLVNRPPGEVPLQTYAVPVTVKTPQKPITVQLTHKDDGEALAVKAGDKIQVTLPEQPSTDFAWEFQKPGAKVLKQAGQPQFTSTNDAIGAPGKTMWTFKVVGPGKASLVADYVEGTAPDTPIKTFDVSVAAKPGYRPKIDRGRGGLPVGDDDREARRRDPAPTGRRGGQVDAPGLEQAPEGRRIVGVGQEDAGALRGQGAGRRHLAARWPRVPARCPPRRTRSAP